jgi:hypothetical protein
VLPLVVAEVGVARAGRDDEVVELQLSPAVEQHPARRGVEARDLAEDDLDVLRLIESVP